MENGISLSPYDFTIYEGQSKKDGKPYRVANLSDSVAFNSNFIDTLVALGAVVRRTIPKEKK